MVIRLVSLYVSHANEKRLREGGAKEYGRANTIALTLAHVAFYLSAIKESIYFNRHINLFTYAGIILFIIAMLTLVLIMLKLGKDWTVKIILPQIKVLSKHYSTAPSDDQIIFLPSFRN
jgi:isoprenylcysteine carboxyl methyltransferase (ICMT) family protein YpbQ